MKSKLPLFVASLALILSILVSFDTQSIKAQIEGVSDFNGIRLQATSFPTATPLLNVRNNGSSVSIQVENSSGTPVWTIDSTGASASTVDLNGNELTLDADADTSITANTDDQIDFEVGGSDVISFTASTATFGIDVQNSGILGDTPTAYTLTGSRTLTPTVTYYELAPAAVLTLTIASGTAGDWLILANTVTTNTVIVDTGATVGGGNITLGENDMAIFKKVDNTWAEVASPDNS